MGGSFRLGRVRGIEIGIHYTWLIAFALIMVSLALAFFPITYPSLSPAMDWILGAAAAILLFASVLGHELSHSVVAQQLGLRVRSITLFIFGGVSNIEGEPKSARDEILIAGAGPLSSIVIGLAFGGLFILLQGVSVEGAALTAYLALINLLLAVFNLIPGFPLDGGRVLRGLIWAVTGNFLQATNIATTIGQVIAYLFIFGGLFLAFTGAFLTGIWLLFIGWFLSSAAGSSRQQAQFERAFEGVRVRDLMENEPITVPSDLTLRDMVDDYVLHRNLRALPVVDQEGNVAGLVTVVDLKKVSREKWDTTTVGEVMTPARELVAVGPQTNAGEALQAMGQRDINQVPVLEGGRLVGLLTRSNMIRYLHLREELGTRP
ncbi:MAG: CBS domain-containing protein [Chloroflexota bacterium]